jgi:hypothetical protein
MASCSNRKQRAEVDGRLPSNNERTIIDSILCGNGRRKQRAETHARWKAQRHGSAHTTVNSSLVGAWSGVEGRQRRRRQGDQSVPYSHRGHEHVDVVWALRPHPGGQGQHQGQGGGRREWVKEGRETVGAWHAVRVRPTKDGVSPVAPGHHVPEEGVSGSGESQSLVVQY